MGCGRPPDHSAVIMCTARHAVTAEYKAQIGESVILRVVSGRRIEWTGPAVRAIHSWRFAHAARLEQVRCRSAGRHASRAWIV